jgi:hypothetical protein
MIASIPISIINRLRIGCKSSSVVVSFDVPGQGQVQAPISNFQFQTSGSTSNPIPILMRHVRKTCRTCKTRALVSLFHAWFQVQSSQVQSKNRPVVTHPRQPVSAASITITAADQAPACRLTRVGDLNLATRASRSHVHHFISRNSSNRSTNIIRSLA